MINAEAQSRGDAENERRTPNIEHRTPKSFPFSVLRSAFGVLHIPHPFSFLLSPFSFLLSPPSFSPASPRLCVSALKNPRRGATLLVTLGILTVLSVMAVTFLVATRLQQQTAAAKTHRLATRDQLHEALHLAMQTVESAYCYTNFTEVPLSAEETVENIPPQRLAPVGPWFSERWERDANISRDHAFQVRGILASPLLASNDFAAAWTANLLKPDVLRLIPPALTNALDLDASSARPFRVGWQEIDPPGQDTDAPWKDTGTRVAFAVFDVSGFLDANYFITGPTTQKLPRVCFSQADVTNWVEKLSTLNAQLSTFNSDPDRTPFSSLSYDPNPNISPLEKDSVNAISHLGTHTFVPVHKFNINSLSNNFLPFAGLTYDGSDKSRLIVMPDRWFRNITGVLQSASIDLNHLDEANGRDAYFGDARKVAWNMVSQMTPSRIPTAFDGAIISQNAYAHRLDYAIEAVPLINEVKLRNISKDPGDANYSEATRRIVQELKDRYTINGNEPVIQDPPDNIYAFDVELCYPFKPAPIPDHSYLWMSVMTNSPPLFIPTRTPYGWLEDYGDNASFGRVLFGRWNTVLAATTNPVPILIENDTVWSFLQTNTVLMTYVNQPDAFDNATNQVEIAEEFSNLWTENYTNDWHAATTNKPFSLALWTTTQSFTNRLTQVVLSDDTEEVNTILRTPYENINWSDGTAWAENFRQLFSETSAAQFNEYDKIPIERDDFKDTDFFEYNNTNTLVCFPYVVTNFAANGIDPESITIRFAPLEGEEGGDKDEYGYDQRKAWLRAMVTVSEINLQVLNNVVGIPEPVDEVLLLRNGNETDGYYQSWDKPGSRSIDEPRDNAWADKWEWSDEDSLGENNDNEYVAESPFIHYDRPFLSIGELGHVNTAIFTNIVDGDLQPDTLKNLKHPSGEDIRRDTIDFSTRSGASLLDKLSIGTFKTPTRGLIQANSTDGIVLRHLHNELRLGWTNWHGAPDQFAILNEPADLNPLIDNWTNTLLRSDAYGFNWEPERNGCPGWASFADMLPDLGTNLIVHQRNLINRLPDKLPDASQYKYDFTEDILRGIVAKDRVSFRQNIFVVVIAAQTLSPVSTPSRPVVLADQRAAVTVIRDAFTGRWTIHDWRWLTE